MRTSILWLSSLLTFAALAKGDADPPARRVRFPNAGISLLMHGPATLEDTSKGAPPNQRLAVILRGGARREVATLIPTTLAPSEYEAALDLVTDGYRENGLRELRKTKVLGRPARDFVMQIGKFEIRTRVLIVPAGIVTLQLGGPKGTVSEQEAQAFFASLRLLGSGR